MPEKKKSTQSPNNFSITLLVLGLIIALAGVGYFAYDQYTKNEDLKIQLNDPEAQANIEQEQANQIVDQLKEIILVDESQGDPAVASVTDSDKLREAQPEFYKDVQEGDFLVIYPSRAIIYRESENRIINIAPIIRPPEELQDAEAVSTPEGEEVIQDAPAEEAVSE